MMTPAAARSLLLVLAQEQAKSQRMLCYNSASPWTYCPVCGSSRMAEATWDFAVVDGRNPVNNEDGLIFSFIIDHPHNKTRCLFPLAGAPSSGHKAQLLLNIAEALRVLNLEERMLGRAQS